MKTPLTLLLIPLLFITGCGSMPAIQTAAALIPALTGGGGVHANVNIASRVSTYTSTTCYCKPPVVPLVGGK